MRLPIFCEQLLPDRLQVLYLFLLETVNTAFDIAMMYEPLVLNFGMVSCCITRIMVNGISRGT